MNTNFTFKTYSFFATIFILALSLNLKAQTSHDVTVSSFSFSPSNLTITVGDEVVWTNTGGSHNVDGKTSVFPSNPASFGNTVGAGWIYKFTFNTAGTYDYQCDPHASSGMVGKITVNPKPAAGPFTLTVNFTGMTPHVGENLWLAVIDQATKVEIGRVKKSVTSAAFSIDVAGIESGKSYNVDFFADHNKNGVYDTAPVDHTWRMLLNNVTGNSVLNFAHNTTFTDIAWKNKLTVHFTGMTPHLGEKITLFLKQTDNGIYRDTVIVPLVAAATFDINSFKIKPGISYNIDFYADHNKNGAYNTPPTDHAWRIPLLNVKGDSLINFVHNTTFTDIFSVTSNETLISDSKNIRLYPNPANQYIQVLVPKTYSAINLIKIFSITGEAIDEKTFSNNQESLRFDISQLKNGIYFMEISAGNQRNVLKFVKQ
jgi:plastocyanin